MTWKQRKINCSFDHWFKDFRRVTLKSIIIPLPQEFITDYLLKDGIFLPPSLNQDGEERHPYDNTDDSSSFSSTYSDESDTIPRDVPCFPELEEKILNSIEELGGVVFPKLNWSAPRDAAWIAFGSTLKCTDVASIYLLLKSSDFIMHDLLHPFDDVCENKEPVENHTSEEVPSIPIEYCLVLRKWWDLNPSCEFRCFVRDGLLIAACQRDFINYFSFLLSVRSEFAESIKSFFEREISGKFTDDSCMLYFQSNTLDSFDIYINKNNRKAFLIDLNPWIPSTDSLLFSWNELQELNGGSFELRLIESQNIADGNSMNQPAFTSNRVPKESIDLGNGELSVGDIDDMISSMRLEDEK
jgi:hypothetical protein